MSNVVKFKNKRKFITTLVIETDYDPSEVGNVSLVMDTATSNEARILSKKVESLKEKPLNNKKAG